MRYKLTGQSKTIDGTTLHQIQAIADFGTIKMGDMGGFIADEKLLPQAGTGWVHPASNIWGGNIWGGNIWGGNIWGGTIWGGIIRGGIIRGGIIRGGIIWGGIIWGGTWNVSPLQIQGSRHCLNVSRPGYLQIGCLENTIAEWQRTFKEIGQNEDYTSDQIAEYGGYIRMAARLRKAGAPNVCGTPDPDAAGESANEHQ